MRQDEIGHSRNRFAVNQSGAGLSSAAKTLDETL
jgi:hypothetical protein